jgi:L-aspartate oxidase
VTGLPTRLAAPPPAWTRATDVVVIGSGVAGLCAARAAATTRRVLLVTKGELAAGSTVWAQGGVAAAIGESDSPDLHLGDTLLAGAGLCDPAAVRILVSEGPARMEALLALGAAFDRDGDGLALAREGGHDRDRILHAGGDATGQEVHRALAAAVADDPRIEVVEHAFALDLLLARRPAQVAGVSVASADGTVGAILARAVVLATGGLGQIYPCTTNPGVATGDGLAIALRAGAATADLEFVQFHPTVLWRPGGYLGQRLLITEALRGEGAVLVDATGARVMTGLHPRADLAPRDVVTKAMTLAATAARTQHLLLDATALGPDVLERRFPTVLHACRAAGIDPVTEPIPVAPAAHYAGGGVCTDQYGRTSLSGLYAAGEVAWTGVHGANRLASNSLLEGLVYGTRAGAHLARVLPPHRPAAVDARPAAAVDPSDREAIVTATGSGAGVLRTAESLRQVLDRLAAVAARAAGAPAAPEQRQAAWEATNLLTVGTALAAAATDRTESRGCHWRADFPEPSPRWLGHLLQRLDGDGELTTRFHPARTAAA